MAAGNPVPGQASSWRAEAGFETGLETSEVTFLEFWGLRLGWSLVSWGGLE